MKTVRVDLQERSYPIYIGQGLLAQVGKYLKHRHSEAEYFLITDEKVALLYGGQVLRSLESEGLNATLLMVPVGEKSKSFEQSYRLYTELISRAATRNAVIIALGGGVVGDLAGFIAATFMRGIRFVQVPTTLLAQVDSSVGGKVGINHPLGKNLIGAFHQPDWVIVDPSVLTTLPTREIIAGLAEVVKYGFIRDGNLFFTIKNRRAEIQNLADLEFVSQILETCCQIKAEIVCQDERDFGLRSLLNFGHTIGHALESVTGYQVYLHGEAIWIGMKGAIHLSMITGHLSSESAQVGLELIRHFKVPPLPRQVGIDDLLEAMQKDKKRTYSGQKWILLQGIGTSTITTDVSLERVKAALAFILSEN